MSLTQRPAAFCERLVPRVVDEVDPVPVIAGQGVGLITGPKPAAGIVRGLMREARQALGR